MCANFTHNTTKHDHLTRDRFKAMERLAKQKTADKLHVLIIFIFRSSFSGAVCESFVPNVHKINKMRKNVNARNRYRRSFSE